MLGDADTVTGFRDRVTAPQSIGRTAARNTDRQQHSTHEHKRPLHNRGSRRARTLVTVCAESIDVRAGFRLHLQARERRHGHTC